jgi:hypothetical protein
MPKKVKRPCDFCTKPFTPIRSTARFCSTACRVKAHRGQVRPASVQHSNGATEDATLSPPQPIDIVDPIQASKCLPGCPRTGLQR